MTWCGQQLPSVPHIELDYANPMEQTAKFFVGQIVHHKKFDFSMSMQLFGEPTNGMNWLRDLAPRNTCRGITC